MDRATCRHLAHFWSWKKVLFFDKKRIPESILANSHIIETTREGTLFFEYVNAPNPAGPYLILERTESPPPFADLPPLPSDVIEDLKIFLRTTELSRENRDYLQNIIDGGIGSESFEKPEFKLCESRDVEGNLFTPVLFSHY